MKAVMFNTSFDAVGAKEVGPDHEWKGAALGNPYKIPPEREEAITEVTFSGGLSKSLVLNTGSLGKPFEVLRDCSNKLLEKWGLDLKRHQHLTRGATPISSPNDWLHSRDYPKKMLSELRDGFINFRLIIEPSGEVSGCKVQQSANPIEFANATCDLVKDRARFEPALDADGKPIRSYWRSAVRWIIS